MKNPNQIILMNKPEELFTNPDNIKDEYRELCKIWHPKIIVLKIKWK